VRSFRIFFKLCGSLFLGFFLFIFLFQNDPCIRQAVAHKLHPFVSRLFSSTVSFDVEKISLVPFCLKVKDVLIRPRDCDDYHWSCRSLRASISWLDFLLYGIVDLYIDIDDLEADSQLGGDGLCLWEHIRSLYSGESSIPIFLRSLSIKRASVQVKERYTNAFAKVNFSLDTRRIGGGMKSIIRFMGGQCCLQDRTLINMLMGPVRVDVFSKPGGSQLLINTNCSLQVPQMGQCANCYLSGFWRYDQGVFVIKNDDRSFVISPIKLYLVGGRLVVEVDGYFPASYLSGFLIKQNDVCKVDGACSLHTNIEFDGSPSLISGRFTSGAIHYNKKEIASVCNVSFHREKSVWDGNFLVSVKGKDFYGGYEWREKNGSGGLKLNNRTQLSIPGFNNWSILPDGLSTQVKYVTGKPLQCNYVCLATNQKAETDVSCSGELTWNRQDLNLNGLFDGKCFSLSFSLFPNFRLNKCKYYNPLGEHLVDIWADKKNANGFSGVIAMPFIHNLLKKTLDYDLQGEGRIKIDGIFKNKKLFARLCLEDGNIRVADTYNFINGLRFGCVIDPSIPLVTFHKFDCGLHRGSFLCKRAIVLFDKNYELMFAHIPITFRDCLLNWKKDLFAVISGQMTFKKEKKKTSMLKGQLFVDRSQLKQNIFSRGFQRKFFDLPGSAIDGKGTDLLIDLQVKTKDPVRVSTSFLETSVKVDVSVEGSLLQPKVLGKLSVLSGSLAFPYKPLYITSGVIGFSSGHLYDPAIEIRAKNKLKRYNIDLSVSGLLGQPEISLESSPPLTEEQIISLLFVGSEKESLNILMPALVMQNIKGIIFGSDQSPTGIRNAFGRLFKPFERIHLVPSFTDQTGRGGLRGALEIDVSDRWRTMIQKNFSLTEDTKVEVEYLLSDDVSLLGTRDERGDISAEVEMRWKF